MNVIFQDLKPDRTLLDSNFDGYKLTLDSLPLYTLNIPDEVSQVKLHEDQYSYQHVKLFTQHNHLHKDPYNLDHVYFIDTHRQIIHTSLTDEFQLTSPTVTYSIPKSEGGKDSLQYNTSLQFPGPELAVLSDGAGNVGVLYTGLRCTAQAWTESLIFKPSIEGQSCEVLDSILLSTSNKYTLHVLVLNIASKDKFNELDAADGDNAVQLDAAAGDRSSQFVNVFEWLTLTSESLQGPWEMTRSRRIVGLGTVEYVGLETTGEAVYIAADKPYKLVHDSLKPVIKKQPPPNKHEAKAPVYIWMQNQEDVTVHLKLPAGTSKADIQVKLTPTQLGLSVKNVGIVLEGCLFAVIDTEASTWTFLDNRLEISLTKANGGLVWTELIKDDKQGEEMMDPEFVEQIHQRLAHLTSDTLNADGGSATEVFNSEQLEECDSFPANTFCLMRICGEQHETTHQVNLGGNQWLFSVRRDPSAMPAMCLRHDVDGLVWQISSQLDSSGNIRVTHSATLQAFGYVQASKEQRQFLSCAPNCSFSAICDLQRHIYVYRQPQAIPTTLRNRKSGREVATVARQQLISLDGNQHNIGFVLSNRNIFILTRNTLFAARVV